MVLRLLAHNAEHWLANQLNAYLRDDGTLESRRSFGRLRICRDQRVGLRRHRRAPGDISSRHRAKFRPPCRLEPRFANEVVVISSDAALRDGQTRAIEGLFVGRQARLLPGVMVLARLTGAQVLMAFARRSPDYRHQVLEIRDQDQPGALELVV